jgi:hypothetical protein
MYFTDSWTQQIMWPAKRFHYCYTCLYLNPADVTAPY